MARRLAIASLPPTVPEAIPVGVPPNDVGLLGYGTPLVPVSNTDGGGGGGGGGNGDGIAGEIGEGVKPPALGYGTGLVPVSNTLPPPPSSGVPLKLESPLPGL